MWILFCLNRLTQKLYAWTTNILLSDTSVSSFSPVVFTNGLSIPGLANLNNTSFQAFEIAENKIVKENHPASDTLKTEFSVSEPAVPLNDCLTSQPAYLETISHPASPSDWLTFHPALSVEIPSVTQIIPQQAKVKSQKVPYSIRKLAKELGLSVSELADQVKFSIHA